MKTRLYYDLLSRLDAGLKALPDKPEETPENTLRALYWAASGEPKSVSLAGISPLADLDEDGTARLRAMVERRLAGTPLAHITGREQFMGLELLAGPEALVPRRETEILGYAALERLRKAGARRGKAVVIDVCTGSGNLAFALATHEPGARVYAADISPNAVALARRNSVHLGLEERVTVRQGDLLAPFDSEEFYGTVDLLTCNPPYISSGKVDRMHEEIREYEPREAFDGGPFGLGILQRIVKDAPRFLSPGGWLAFEVGLGQSEMLVRRIQREGRYREVCGVRDERGQIRAVLSSV